MTANRLRIVAALLAVVLLAGLLPAGAAFAATAPAQGLATALEFAGPDFVSFTPQVTATDSIDVGFAPSCGGGPSGSGFVGWDIDEVGVAYNRNTDTLFVGISMWNNVIAGDPENNGNPNTTDPCLTGSGGRDIPNLGESEAIDFVIDAGNDGTFEYIAGVSRTTDINGFTVARYTGLQPPPTSPGLGFGTAVGSGSITNNPAAGAPDFEFKINNFAALLGKTPNDTLIFCFAARAGSQEDNGFGEDSIPGAGCFPVTFEAYDFGDDPDPSYPTLLASNGAYHVIDGVTYLGSRVDAEPNGQPTANADGDDLSGVPDDEDGIVFNTALVQCQQATLTATASTSGRLDAWIDFNGDGDWADAGEKIANSQLLSAGANTITFTVPCSAVPGTTYTRFRFSKAGGLSYTGKAPDGEVEDYKVQITAPQPAIDIQKTVYAGHNNGASCPGGELVTGVSGTQVTYCFVVTNTGETYLNPVTINDANLGITQAQMTLKSGTLPLAPGATLVYYYQTTITGDLTNTACTEGRPSDAGGNALPGGVNVNDCDSAQVDRVTPSIDIQKTVYAGHNNGASCPGGELVTGVSGTQVTYCFVVTNTGDTYLSPVTLSDAQLGITQAQMTLKSGTLPLAPGATLVYYYQTTITRDLVNTVCTDGNPSTSGGADLPNAPNVTDCDDARVDLVTPSIDVQKTVYAGHNNGASCPGGELVTGISGAAVTYCFEVTNTGDTYLNPVTLTDANLGITQAQMTLQSGTLPLAPGAKLVYYYQTTITRGLTNTVCTDGNPSNASGADLPNAPNVTDCDTAQVNLVTPSIDIQKTVYAGHNNGASCPGGELVTGVSGTQVTYCFVVTNTGSTYLNPVTINDADLGITQAQMTLKSGTLPLAPGATLVYYYQTTITRDLTNTACTDGNPSDANGGDIPSVPNVDDCDNAQVEMVAPSIDVQKTVYAGHNNGASCPGSELVSAINGAAVTYCFEVTNTGDTYLDPVMLSDTDLGITQVQMTVKSGTLPLAPGAKLVYYYQTTIQRDLLNTVCTDGNPSTATGADIPGVGNVSDCDTAQVKQIGPGVALEKTVLTCHNCGPADPPACPGAELVVVVNGSAITYCFQVINTGDTYLSNIAIADPDLGITTANMTLLSGTLPLAPGQSLVYYYKTFSAGNLVNLARVTGAPSDSSGNPLPGAPTVDDQDTAQVQELRLVDLGDWAWNDANRNGIQDPGETGLANVLVKLYRADGVFLGSKTTDANGYYRFTDLGPGDYYLEFTGPAGWVHSPHLKGTDRAKDSDPNQFSGRTWTITLDGSADDLTRDAGFYYEPNTAHLGDFIWNDLNQDGIQDTGEPGYAGVLVCLYNDVDRDGAFDPGGDTPVAGAGDQPSPFSHCVRTSSTGYYLFRDLPAGMYIVQVDPSNFNAGQPLNGTIGSPPNRGSNDQIDSDCSQASNAAAWNLVGGVTWLGLDCAFHRAEPTPVVMLDRDTYAREINGLVQIHWATAMEQNIAGFNILRGVFPDPSRAVRLNAQLIPARGATGRGETYYRFDDRTVQRSGAYLYWVQVVERDGSTELPLPALKVVLTGQRTLFVPAISVRR